jgi:hypothetical protein
VGTFGALKKNEILCSEPIDKCPIVHYIYGIEIPNPIPGGSKWNIQAKRRT